VLPLQPAFGFSSWAGGFTLIAHTLEQMRRLLQWLYSTKLLCLLQRKCAILPKLETGVKFGF